MLLVLNFVDLKEIRQKSAFILIFMKCEFRKLFFVTRDVKNLNYEPIFVTYHSILHDFGTQVLRIVRVVYREWFRHAICNMEPSLSHSRFLLASNTVSKISTGHLKRASYFLIFVTWENEFFLSESRDPLFFRFTNCARDPTCTTLITAKCNTSPGITSWDSCKQIIHFINYFLTWLSLDCCPSCSAFCTLLQALCRILVYHRIKLYSYNHDTNWLCLKRWPHIQNGVSFRWGESWRKFWHCNEICHLVFPDRSNNTNII